ncbi:MAG: hypothetical protein L6R40_005586 [Gallowayella cf. fulva]|nr:MAG: hypothetical protein L6R40_005586 [Xanthomendoza cf. fulva]
MPLTLPSLILPLLTFVVLAPLSVYAIPVDAASPGDPTPFDQFGYNDTHAYPIDDALFETFKFVSWQQRFPGYASDLLNTQLPASRSGWCNNPLRIRGYPKFDDTGYIVVTGHSLGGVVATLAAAEIRTISAHFLAETELYTFGSPRIANKEAARWLSQQSRYSWRITNETDLIPRSPPRVIGYHHVEPEYWISDHGDNPSRADIQWRGREGNDWGNEGMVIPSRSAHHKYFGDISACKPDNGD